MVSVKMIKDKVENDCIIPQKEFWTLFSVPYFLF
jgi:hypothetical protein